MDLLKYGLLALFTGDSRASELTNIDLPTIQYCRKQISFHSSPCFAKLSNVISELCDSNGIEYASEYLSLPIELLKHIYVKEPEHMPEPLSNIPQIEPTSIELPQKRPYPPDTHPLDKINQLSLKERVRVLYAKPSFNLLAIRKLYDLPSVNLVHAWGDFARKTKLEERETSRKLRKKILKLRTRGETDINIAAELNISSNRVVRLACETSRTKLIYSSAEVRDFYRERQAMSNNRSLIAVELGIPFNSVKRLLGDSGSMLEVPWYLSDDEGGSIEKVKAVEGLFILENEDIVGEYYGLSPTLIRKWATSVQQTFKRPEH